MMDRNLSFIDIEGALIMISYDAVSIEDESETWSNCLPYTFEDGNLIRYELDGDDEIDQTIDLANYAVAQTTPFDMDNVLVDFLSGLDRVPQEIRAKYENDGSGKPHYDDTNMALIKKSKIMSEKAKQSSGLIV